MFIFRRRNALADAVYLQHSRRQRTGLCIYQLCSVEGNAAFALFYIALNCPLCNNWPVKQLVYTGNFTVP
jgi:hypothetical protein